ncbi:thiamine diphosphokinase [bacterium]|nr:thiamine diphosphokinase [bacterium]
MSETTTRALIVLNGEIEPSLPYVNREDYVHIVATDGALDVLLENDWPPTVALGDFDSVNAGTLEIARSRGIYTLHTPDQDFTDFEKALNFVEAETVQSVDIIGHTGRRLDHTLGSIHATARAAGRLNLQLIDPIGTGHLIAAGETFEIDDCSGQTCSVIALIPARVNLDGFRWPLNESRLGGVDGQSVSNEIASDRARVRVLDGVAMVYLHHAPCA